MILVFGADGMLGSALMQRLRASDATVRGTSLSGSGPFVDLRNVDIASAGSLERAFAVTQPTIAINCAGVVKSEAQNIGKTWAANADAPYLISRIARDYGCRLIHVSTDCVFNGKHGNYNERDVPDAEDEYGRSKAAGESIALERHCIVLRTSFIGRDPRRKRGLLEWLLAHEDGVVPGFVRARWSGLSASELARAILLAVETPQLYGLYHVSGRPISKADLLEILVQELGLRCHVERLDGNSIDRTLDGSRFTEATGYVPPEWVEMVRRAL